MDNNPDIPRISHIELSYKQDKELIEFLNNATRIDRARGMFGFKKKVRHMNAGNTTFYQFDRDTGFWGIPDISHEIVYDVAPDTPVRATHNSDGNRDTEFAFRPGEKNVIFLGGSHTWGLAVEQGARYTDLLGQEANCNALNMAHPSLGLDQNALALFRKTPKFKPDIVVIEQYPWALHRVLSTSVNGFCAPFFH